MAEDYESQIPPAELPSETNTVSLESINDRDPEEIVLGKEQIDEAYTAIDKLSPDQRKVILERNVNLKTRDQVASDMGVTAAKIKVLEDNGMDQLRGRLDVDQPIIKELKNKSDAALNSGVNAMVEGDKEKAQQSFRKADTYDIRGGNSKEIGDLLRQTDNIRNPNVSKKEESTYDKTWYENSEVKVIQPAAEVPTSQPVEEKQPEPEVVASEPIQETGAPAASTQETPITAETLIVANNVSEKEEPAQTPPATERSLWQKIKDSGRNLLG